jgi:preprotein translocase subunit SecE
MPRKKKELSKREKVFNFISNIIDLIQEKWRTYIKVTIALAFFSLFIYVVFFWIDTVQEIRFEIIYI